ncbi:MAG: FkbM family methyltransferase, partial [Gammaproteobacteria bacterium]
IPWDWRVSLYTWTKGIASFNPAHHELGQTPADAMIPEKVKCASLDELLKTHGFTHLDLLQIDTEGYDAEIIEGIDFNATRPRIVRFEHGRLRSMSKDTFQHIRAGLHAAGYELMIETFDVTAYQPDILLDL